jgi:hypothetical protein
MMIAAARIRTVLPQWPPPGSNGSAGDVSRPTRVARRREILYDQFMRPRVRKTGAAIGLILLGLLLSGCDRCGDWYSPFENPFKPSPNSCRNGDAPK